MPEKERLGDFFRLSGVPEVYINEIITCLKKNGFDTDSCIYRGDRREERMHHLSMMMLNKYLHILEHGNEADDLMSYWDDNKRIDKRIKGDIHVHTVFSDGTGTVEKLASEAAETGYNWIGFTDHSPVSGNDYRLTSQKFYERHERIIKAEESSGIKIYESIEADISENGDLLFPDKWLDHLDYIIVSLHEKIEDYSRALNRIERAVSSPMVAVFAHPFFGLQQDYDPLYIIDLLDILHETGTAVEFNLSSQYIPFNFSLAEECRKRDILLAFSTDAHFIGNMKFMRLASLYLPDYDNGKVLNYHDKLPINENSF